MAEQKEWKEKSVAGKLSEQISKAKVTDKVDDDTKDEITGNREILRSFALVWNVANCAQETKTDKSSSVKPGIKTKFLTYNNSCLLGISDAKPMSMNIEAFEAAINLAETQRMVTNECHIAYERKEGLARADPVIIQSLKDNDDKSTPRKEMVIIIAVVYLTPIPGTTDSSKDMKESESKILEIINDNLRIMGAGTLMIQDFSALDQVQQKLITEMRFDEESTVIAKSAVVDSKIILPIPNSKFNNEKQRAVNYKADGGEDDNKEIKEMDQLLSDMDKLEELMMSQNMRPKIKKFFKPLPGKPTDNKYIAFSLKMEDIKDEELIDDPKVKDLIGKSFTLPYGWVQLVKMTENEITEIVGQKASTYKESMEDIEKGRKDDKHAREMKMKAIDKKLKSKEKDERKDSPDDKKEEKSASKKKAKRAKTPKETKV